MMLYTCSPIWFSPHIDIRARIRFAIESARDRMDRDRAYVFFRADDIASPSKNFNRVIELFNRYRAPLALAVVPAWLSKPRWQYLKDLTSENFELFCLHQHGWRHVNHEITGKYQEFGRNRSLSLKKADILKGKKYLESLMGQSFYPIFTPPWNRCDMETIKVLKTLGFYGISRIRSKSSRQDILPEFPINIDLHTRIEKDPEQSMDNLLNELKNALYLGTCGIMIHHQKMNDFAFYFLEILIEELSKIQEIQILSMKSLVHANMKKT